MKLKLSVESGKRPPNGEKDPSGMFVAWGELGGEPITGVLARHSTREVAEHDAQLELARRIRILFTDPRWTQVTDVGKDA